jgi:hypothetical protein
MRFNAPRIKPTRGIIIVDTSALYYMAMPLNKLKGDYLSDTAKQYLTEQKYKGIDANVNLLDALTFLSENGYEIIIPEMVAFECSGIIRNGDCSDRFFSKGSSGIVFFRMHRTARRYH